MTHQNNFPELMPDMGTKDTPQGVVGFKFAHALLKRDYDTALAMLSAELKLEYSVLGLKQSFEEMISLANPLRNYLTLK